MYRRNLVSALQHILERHEVGWIGDCLSCKRDVPFFYKDMESPNPAYKIDAITADPKRKDWYFRIYEGNRLVRKDRHFASAEQAYAAGSLILNDEQATELSLRRIERWAGDHSYAVDGHAHADPLVSEVEPNKWWIFVDRESNQRQYSGPWTSLEEASLVYKFHLCTVN
jgi:hypothetical protein